MLQAIHLWMPIYIFLGEVDDVLVSQGGISIWSCNLRTEVSEKHTSAAPMSWLTVENQSWLIRRVSLLTLEY